MEAHDTRPDPDALLARLKAQEARAGSRRGKLRIYLGYAAGVGKTYTMLQAAHDAVRQGIEVVAGYVEPHTRPDTQAQAEGLETIPPLMVPYKGTELREFDLDAALKRHPKVCLVDELAHTNAPGLRHLKRYMDIEELLDAGINVWTTVNIQHLESLNDIVSSITGIRVREKVPDDVFDHADQVKVIDIEPEELITRLSEGKIYRMEQAERAKQNFFTTEKLIALREIALRRTADRVNHLAVEERKILQREGDYYTGEHVLTCISASPTCARVIRTASRLAYAFHAEFTAIYVETPYMQGASHKMKKAMEDNLHLAQALGAKIATVFGEDVAFQIANYARVGNVSKIVLGRTNHRIILGQTKGALSERIAQYVPGIDIYIIPDVTKDEAAKGYHSLIAGDRLMRNIRWREQIVWDTVKITALASLFTFAVFQIFGIHMSHEHVIMLLIMAFIISTLLATVRRQAQELIKKSHRTEILLENSSKLRRCVTIEDVEREIAGRIIQLMDLSVIFYLREDRDSETALKGPDFFPREGMTKDEMASLFTEQQEVTTASWVMNNGKRAGCTTSSLPNAKAIYLPVKQDQAVYAVVGIYLEEVREIEAFEYGIIIAMLNEAALAFAKRYGDFWGETLDVTGAGLDKRGGEGESRDGKK